MDHTSTSTSKEKGRTDATHDQVGSGQPQELACDHTIELLDQYGKLRGSWKGEDSSNGIRYSCRNCGWFYGYQPDKKAQEAMYHEYPEQQQRLNGPGCGDGPFMG